MIKGRIYNKTEEIDSGKVQQFFENRFCKENPLASVMVRGNSSDDIAYKRNEKEKHLLLNLIDFSNTKGVLDIGCGCGRWVENLGHHIKYYDGIDFCNQYIVTASEYYKNFSNIKFHNMDVLKLNISKLKNQYDLIILNGICMYLNDIDLKSLFSSLNSFIGRNGKIYLRESVSTMNDRLTLKEFYSEELECEYNAVYRTPAEYENVNFDLNLKIINNGFLLEEETGKRDETNQKYWLLEKNKQ